MSTKKYGIKDASNDLAFLMTLTGIFSVDDEGFWILNSSGERFKYDPDKGANGREIVNFQENMPKGDYYYFNPFAEGFGRKSDAVTLYYNNLKTTLNVRIGSVMVWAAEQIIASKNNPDISIDPAALPISSVMIDRKTTIHDNLDDKSVEEIKKILTRSKYDLLSIQYLRETMTSKVKICPLTDETWDSKFTDGIRKKTVAAFKALLMGVLGISDASEAADFSVKYDPKIKTKGELYATLSSYLNICLRFADALSQIAKVDSERVDLEELSQVIERLAPAYAVARHMIQPTIGSGDVSSLKAGDTTGVGFGQTQVSRFAPTPVDGQPAIGGSFGFSGPQRSKFEPEVVAAAPGAYGRPSYASPPAQPSFGSNFGGGFNNGSGFGQNPSGGFGFSNSGSSSFGNAFGSPMTNNSYFR